MPVYVWRDPNPVDGCAIVDFTVMADSLKDAATLARDVPWSRCRTAKKLREIGWAREAKADEDLPSRYLPSVVFWEGDDGWNRLPGVSAKR